jgi:hypothetical protein
MVRPRERWKGESITKKLEGNRRNKFRCFIA